VTARDRVSPSVAQSSSRRRFLGFLIVARWNISASRLPKAALSTGAILSVRKSLRNSCTSSGSHDLPLALVSLWGMFCQRNAYTFGRRLASSCRSSASAMLHHPAILVQGCH
jgi:hypothetical protein